MSHYRSRPPSTCGDALLILASLVLLLALALIGLKWLLF